MLPPRIPPWIRTKLIQAKWMLDFLQTNHSGAPKMETDRAKLLFRLMCKEVMVAMLQKITGYANPNQAVQWVQPQDLPYGADQPRNLQYYWAFWVQTDSCDDRPLPTPHLGYDSACHLWNLCLLAKHPPRTFFKGVKKTMEEEVTDFLAMLFSLATQKVLLAEKTNRCLHPIINLKPLKHCTLRSFACLQTGNRAICLDLKVGPWIWMTHQLHTSGWIKHSKLF